MMDTFFYFAGIVAVVAGSIVLVTGAAVTVAKVFDTAADVERLQERSWKTVSDDTFEYLRERVRVLEGKSNAQ